MAAWYKRNPRRTFIIVNVVLITFVLVIAEMAFRHAGYQAGIIGKEEGFFSGELELFNGFEADKYGITHYSSRAVKVIDSLARVEGIDSATIISVLQREGFTSELFAPILDLKSGEKGRSRKTKRTEYLAMDSLGGYEAAYAFYAERPLNPQGFRSIPFHPYETGRKKILLLGDSFTWGHSAENIYDSFADILLEKGYLVYNSGITGADPAQYLAIAQRWIPILKPDIVIVNFFHGNDIFYYHRKAMPGQMFYYPTDKGFVYNCPRGQYFPDLKSTLKYLKGKAGIPNTNSNGFNRFCSGTVLGTQFWQLLKEINVLSDTLDFFVRDYDNRTMDNIYSKPVTEFYIKEIEQISMQHDARMILTLIPEMSEIGTVSWKDWPGLFTDYIPNEIPGIDAKHYNAKSSHFNSEGHRFYAEFLEGLILAKPSPQSTE